MSTPPSRRGRYVPLVWRVAALNAGLLVAAVIVTVVVLAPRKLSTVALDEASVLVGGLLLVALGNLLVLRRIVGPLAQLTDLARKVDLSAPARMPDATPDSEAGELALTFNEMLTRLETERHEATGRVLAGQEAERLRIALELRPEALDELGLESALAVLGERFAERSGISVTQDISPGLPGLDPDVELVIYRIVQEALTNVARHSGATRATVTVSAPVVTDDGTLLVEIADPGQGLSPEGEPGTGIRGMQERAAAVGGILELGPGPGDAGCLVRLRVPPQVPASAADTDRPTAGSVAGGDELADDAHPAG